MNNIAKLEFKNLSFESFITNLKVSCYVILN